MKSDIRAALGNQQPYYMLCREERNLCAILYHLLLLENNLNSFLKLAKVNWIADSTAEIYVEYSFLRDLWKSVWDPEKKRRFLLDFLGYPEDYRLRTASYEKFNEQFGATPKASVKCIQSPSTWSMERYNKNGHTDERFRQISYLKWAFNAKPDIVITLPGKGTLCIEAKLESGEARYPQRKKERDIFRQRGLCLVNQTDVQRLIFDLLGIHAEFRFLVDGKGGKANESAMTWQRVFDVMDKRHLPPFVREWIDRLCRNTVASAEAKAAARVVRKSSRR